MQGVTLELFALLPIFFYELRVHIFLPSALGYIAGHVEEGAGLLAGGTSIGGRIGLDQVSAFGTLPFGHSFTSNSWAPEYV